MPSRPRSQSIIRSAPARLLLAALAMACAAPLQGQNWADYDYEDLEFRGIGLVGGRVWPASVEATGYFGIQTDLGFIGPAIRIIPSARFWSSSMKAAELDRLSEQILRVCDRQPAAICPERLELGEVKISDLELILDAHYVFGPEKKLSPFLGATLGLHLLNGRGDFIDDTFVEDLLDTVAPGFGPILGFTFDVGSAIRIGAEARFMLASDIRYAGFGATGVWTLPKPGPGANTGSGTDGGNRR